MANYKAIKGFTIQEVDTDPTLIEGQVWYNTATKKLKAAGLAAGTWASGTAVNTARFNGLMSGGTYTAAIIAGGGTSPTALSSLTETWDGSSWTETGDLDTARDHMTGFGTTTAAIAAGGHVVSTAGGGAPGIPGSVAPAQTLSETWDGSSWTETGDLPTALSYGIGAGTATAGLYIAGYARPPVSPQTRAETYEYDGSSWTDASADVGTARYDHAATGTQTASIMGGGLGAPPSPRLATTQTYDGSSWTDAPDINTARGFYGHGNSGIQTDAMFFGGATAPARSALTELFDGTSWSEDGDLNTAISGGGSSQAHGSTANSLSISGSTGSGTTAVEAWTGPSTAARTFTSS